MPHRNVEVLKRFDICLEKKINNQTRKKQKTKVNKKLSAKLKKYDTNSLINMKLCLSIGDVCLDVCMYVCLFFLFHLFPFIRSVYLFVYPAMFLMRFEFQIINEMSAKGHTSALL